MTLPEIAITFYFGMLTLICCVLLIKLIWGSSGTGVTTYKNPPPPPPKRKFKERIEVLAEEIVEENKRYQPKDKLDTSNPPTGCYQPIVDNTKKPQTKKKKKKPPPPPSPQPRIIKYK
jgi:hypothetical protein